MAAQRHWIKDDSLSKTYTEHWNKASQLERARLLKEAGRGTHHKARAWHSLVVLILAFIAAQNLVTDMKPSAQSEPNDPPHTPIPLEPPLILSCPVAGACTTESYISTD